jgi:hypothetical protein
MNVTKEKRYKRGEQSPCGTLRFWGLGSDDEAKEDGMIAQLDLSFSKVQRNTLDEDLARLIELLSWSSDWRTARQISRELDMSDRYIRELAEASEGQIIGTNLGYKLTARVTPEEFSEWSGRYNSQIKRMLERLQRTTKNWHRRGK